MPPSTKRPCRPQSCGRSPGRSHSRRRRSPSKPRAASATSTAAWGGQIESRTSPRRQSSARSPASSSPPAPRSLGGRHDCARRRPREHVSPRPRRAARPRLPSRPDAGGRRPSRARFSPTPSRPSCARRRRRAGAAPRRAAASAPPPPRSASPRRSRRSVRAGPQEEEAHDLEDPLAVALPRGRVRVADVAELLDDPPLDAGLLAHLAHGRVGRDLAGVDLALRQRPDALGLPLRPDRGDIGRPRIVRTSTPPAENSRSTVTVLPVGTCATRVPTVEWLRHSRGESARNCHEEQSGGSV